MRSQSKQNIEFGPFRLDLVEEQLWCGQERVPLRPKLWLVLRYLAERPHRLISKNELLEAVWPGVTVYEEAAARAIRELRQVLGDGPDQPQFIEVLYGRGYRFLVDGRAPVGRLPVAPTTTALENAWGSFIGDTTTPLVGRDRELASLRALAAQTHAAPRMVLVTGEAGIGKSRLAAESAREFVDAGAKVVVGRCYEGVAQLPFWPWSQVLRACMLPFEPRSGSEAPTASWAADLLPLVPELAPHIGEVPSPMETSHARFRLFDAAIRTLQWVARRQPLVVLLEDVHWIDPDSLALLNVLVRESVGHSITVLATHRSGDDDNDEIVKPALMSLQRDNLLQLIELGGLAHVDSTALLTELAGAPIDAALASDLVRDTGGNPFFCKELWRHLHDERAVGVVNGSWKRQAESSGVPNTIRSTLRRRLQRLSPNAVAFLQAAAIHGPEIDFALAVDAAGIESSRGIDAVDEVLAAGLIREVATSPGAYRFVHSLLVETLCQDLSNLRRARVHWRIGEILETRLNLAEGLVAQIAFHLTRGVSHGNAMKAAAFARMAAQQATASAAYEAAIAHLRAGLEVLGTSAEFSDSRRRMLLELGEGYDRAGDGFRSRECFEAAVALARESGAKSDLARAALGMSTRWTFADPTVIALLEESLHTCAPDDERSRARLRARLAQSLYMMPDSRERREQECRAALDLAEHIGDAEVVACVASDSLEALFDNDNYDHLENLAGVLERAATSSGDFALQWQAHSWRVVIALCRGRLRRADAELEICRTLAEHVRQPRALAVTHTHAAALATVRGNFHAAEEHARSAAALGHRFYESSFAWIAYVQLFTIRREQARSLELESDDRSVRPPHPDDAGGEMFLRAVRWQLPFSLLEQGQPNAARQAFDALKGEFSSIPPENSRNLRLVSLVAFSDVAATFGDREAARRLLPMLEPYATQWVVVGFGLVVAASVHNAIGMLKGVLGDCEAARAHFEQAIAQHEQEGAMLVQARTLHNYARMLLAAGGPMQVEKARTLIGRGLEIADAHGFSAVRGKLLRLEQFPTN